MKGRGRRGEEEGEVARGLSHSLALAGLDPIEAYLDTVPAECDVLALEGGRKQLPSVALDERGVGGHDTCKALGLCCDPLSLSRGAVSGGWAAAVPVGFSTGLGRGPLRREGCGCECCRRSFVRVSR